MKRNSNNEQLDLLVRSGQKVTGPDKWKAELSKVTHVKINLGGSGFLSIVDANQSSPTPVAYSSNDKTPITRGIT